MSSYGEDLTAIRAAGLSARTLGAGHAGAPLPCGDTRYLARRR